MTLKYKAGLFRIWLVLCFLWIVVSAWAGLSWGAVVSVPVAVGVVVYLVVWVIEQFPAPPVDVTQLRQKIAANLGVAKPEDSEVYKTTWAQPINLLEAKYGEKIPITEIHGLQQLISAKLDELQVQRQELINREAKAGKAIEIEELRQTLQNSAAAAYTGPERDAYAMQIDEFLTSLATKYGSRIPVDHAFKIMQDLEAGREYRQIMQDLEAGRGYGPDD